MKTPIFYAELRESDGDITLFKVRAFSVEDATQLVHQSLGQGHLVRYHWVRDVLTTQEAKERWAGFLRSAPKI